MPYQPETILKYHGPALADDEEPGRRYEFRFLTEAEYADEPNKWFRVGRIMHLVGAYELTNMLTAEGYQNEFSMTALAKLHAVVHTERLINYYADQRKY